MSREKNAHPSPAGIAAERAGAVSPEVKESVKLLGFVHTRGGSMEIRTVGVVGAGTMGNGIAHV
ncbi:MAG: hypothetical protein ACM34G_14520, partial [Acidobacteriota bacterium]